MDVKINAIGKITFETFCETCEKLKSLNANQKYEFLSKYLNECRKLSDDSNNVDLYPIMRLLIPQAERERRAYGIKETTFAKLYVRAMNLPKHGIDALKLINYKAPSSSASTNADFAEVAFWVLKSRCQTSKRFTLDDINSHLDKIASYHGKNQQRAIDDELTKMITGMSAAHQKWMIRIILKDMKLGMGQTKILASFHRDAPDYFDSTSSLQKVCSTLHSWSVHLNEIEVELFSSFRPMLSERLDITKINSLLKGEDVYFLEQKFDGERFQIHMKDGKFKYFSRNGFDYTENYGDKFDADGVLTKYLKNSLSESASSFIIDGEMMGWHKTKKIFSSKGINFDVKKITDDSNFRPCFCAFDILLYNDKILTNTPLEERIKYLDDLFKNVEGIILHSDRQRVSDSKVVLDKLNKAIDDQEEGIVIKTVTSLYKPNSRKAGWYKIKPEYTDGVMTELDFLILGGYYAENKQHGIIGSVLLGVADTENKIDDKPTKFFSCGRVKLTIARDEFVELCNKLEPHLNVVKKDILPPSIIWTKDKPDLWIEPKNSFIVQVKATELVRSSQFKTDYTVRFPRIEKIRYDKPWYDCLTSEEFTQLTQYSHGVEKLTGRNISSEDLKMEGEVSPRKKTKMIHLADQFQPVCAMEIEEKSNLFAGKEFCVMTGNDKFSKSDLEKKILENGGKVVQNSGKNTFCIIAGNENVRVANAISSNLYNVATVEWLIETLDEKYIATGKLMDWRPQDLIGTSPEIADAFHLKYDEFGDSYTSPATMESIKHSFAKIEHSVPTYITTREMLELDRELFGGPSPHSFMRSCTIYFANTDSRSKLENMQLEFIKMNVRFYGGKCCKEIDDCTTHVVVSLDDDDNIRNILKHLQTLNYMIPVATMDWVLKCLELKGLINVTEHLVDVEKYLT